VAGLLIAFGALVLRLQQVLFGKPSGSSGQVKASYVPLFLHLGFVLVAGLWLPEPIVRWFRVVAAQLGWRSCRPNGSPHISPASPRSPIIGHGRATRSTPRHGVRSVNRSAKAAAISSPCGATAPRCIWHCAAQAWLPLASFRSA